MKVEDLRFLLNLGRRIATQDGQDRPEGPTHATAYPLYMVEETRRIYGIDPAHTDPDGWIEVDDDGEEIRECPTQPLGNSVAFIERGELVQGAVALTREGIDRYLAVNGHNLKSPRVYVASLWRVAEMQELRQVLMRLAADIDEKGETHRAAPVDLSAQAEEDRRLCWHNRYSDGPRCPRPATWRAPDGERFPWQACDEHRLATDVPIDEKGETP